MARLQDKEKALQLRKKGWSYSMIKEELGISKSTLSGWLRDRPLSEERIRELKDNSSRRIEKFRETMRRKRENKLDQAYKKAKKDIKKLSKRELFLAGLFLYWGEGFKTADTTTAIANTDPSLLHLFVKWLKIMGVPLNKIKVKVQIYNDMNQEEVVRYWQKQLGLPVSCFNQIYTKNSRLSDVSYKSGFGHGTCNVLVHNRELNDYVLMSLKYLQEELYYR